MLVKTNDLAVTFWMGTFGKQARAKKNKAVFLMYNPIYTFNEVLITRITRRFSSARWDDAVHPPWPLRNPR